MLQIITVAAKSWICSMLVLVLLMTFLTLVECKALIDSNSLQIENSNSPNVDSNGRQFLFIKGANGETTTPDFIRLVVMRFIYGLATTMGVEDRLEGLFNGAFVPPNAENDFFGFGGFGNGGADVGDFDEAAFESLFGDDGF